jgi:hypothetical protein
MWRMTVSDKKSHSATDEPWKHPGQNSVDPDNQHPINDAAEQEARARKSQWEKADPKKLDPKKL